MRLNIFIVVFPAYLGFNFLYASLAASHYCVSVIWRPPHADMRTSTASLSTAPLCRYLLIFRTTTWFMALSLLLMNTYESHIYRFHWKERFLSPTYVPAQDWIWILIQTAFHLNYDVDIGVNLSSVLPWSGWINHSLLIDSISLVSEHRIWWKEHWKISKFYMEA